MAPKSSRALRPRAASMPFRRGLAVLERVERNRERDEKPPIDIADLRLELEHVAVADCSEYSLVLADFTLRTLEHEVEWQPGQQVEPVRPELSEAPQERDDPARLVCLEQFLSHRVAHVP